MPVVAISQLWSYEKHGCKSLCATTRSSAVAERPGDALCHWIFR